MSQYRILKKTHADETVKYTIQKQSVFDYEKWYDVTDRQHISDARHAISVLKDQEVVMTEVVE
jgi:hypothetical protein